MGEVFGGRYELIDLIGEGGMGVVWRAWDQRQQRLVAAKVLRQSDASTLLRFVREQALRVDHPHVIAPLSWTGEDDRVLFTMRIVSGGSLATLIGDHGPLPPRFSAEILRQVLSGLRAVHSARLIHRDIKPANILLDATGTGRPYAFLTDFGIAIDLDGPRFTETGKVHGTPGYLAPELMRLGDITPAVDLYAVGMLGATMLTGMRPREFDIAQEPPPNTPESLWRLIRALGHPEPPKRPSLEEALHELSRPELAWSDDAIGEVEVLQQLPPLPQPGQPQSTPPRASTPTPPHALPVAPQPGSPSHLAPSGPAQFSQPPPPPGTPGSSPHPAAEYRTPPTTLLKPPAERTTVVLPPRPTRGSRWLLLGSAVIVIGGIALLVLAYLS